MVRVATAGIWSGGCGIGTACGGRNIAAVHRWRCEWRNAHVILRKARGDGLVKLALQAVVDSDGLRDLRNVHQVFPRGRNPVILQRQWAPVDFSAATGVARVRRWHPGHVGLLFRLAEFLIVILPLAGMVIAAIRAFTANKRRAEESRDSDRARIPDAATVPPGRTGSNQAAQWRSLRRVLEEHRRADTRWLEYELDFAKLLDFPLMTDMRDPLTIGFHKAKLRADFLRPVKAEDLLDDREAAAQYLAAVEDYVTAFNVAEAEARRRRRNNFSRDGQQRIARAQSLLRVASDSAAAPQERQNAYDLARKELDGLIVLPSTTQASIERGISGQIEG